MVSCGNNTVSWVSGERCHAEMTPLAGYQRNGHGCGNGPISCLCLAVCVNSVLISDSVAGFPPARRCHSCVQHKNGEHPEILVRLDKPCPHYYYYHNFFDGYKILQDNVLSTLNFFFLSFMKYINNWSISAGKFCWNLKETPKTELAQVLSI